MKDLLRMLLVAAGPSRFSSEKWIVRVRNRKVDSVEEFGCWIKKQFSKSEKWIVRVERWLVLKSTDGQQRRRDGARREPCLAASHDLGARDPSI